MVRIILFICFCFSAGLSAQDVTIAEARENDADGVMILLDEPATVEGVTVGFNFRPGGITWVIFDLDDNIGLSVFNTNDTLGYSFKQGDLVRISGTLTQFNGLSQIAADAIEVVSEGNMIPDPQIIQALDEDSESRLVTFQNCELVDPDQWQNSGSFNVEVTNGISIIQVRIDSDTDISGRGAPTGVFSITGMGGQFDSDVPYDEGYQIFPRYSTDIDPYNEEGVTYAPLSIDEANNTDADGIAVYDGDQVELTGTTLGINFRPAGLQFALVDDDNNGIGLFNLEGDLGYSYAEGDNITVQGAISQFNGLTQINPDNIVVNSSGNSLPESLKVDVLGENTESSFVRLNGSYTLTDENQWLGDGSDFNVDISNGTNLITMRIDADTEMSTMMAPAMPFTLHGVGGQFDNEVPYNEGYQILPRTRDDINETLSAEDLIAEYGVQVFPLPVNSTLHVNANERISSIAVFDITGRRVLDSEASSLDMQSLNPGQYILKIRINKETISYPISKH